MSKRKLTPLSQEVLSFLEDHAKQATPQNVVIDAALRWAPSPDPDPTVRATWVSQVTTAYKHRRQKVRDEARAAAKVASTLTQEEVVEAAMNEHTPAPRQQKARSAPKVVTEPLFSHAPPQARAEEIQSLQDSMPFTVVPDGRGGAQVGQVVYNHKTPTQNTQPSTVAQGDKASCPHTNIKCEGNSYACEKCGDSAPTVDLLRASIHDLRTECHRLRGVERSLGESLDASNFIRQAVEKAREGLRVQRNELSTALEKEKADHQATRDRVAAEAAQPAPREVIDAMNRTADAVQAMCGQIGDASAAKDAVIETQKALIDHLKRMVGAR